MSYGRLISFISTCINRGIPYTCLLLLEAGWLNLCIT